MVSVFYLGYCSLSRLATAPDDYLRYPNFPCKYPCKPARSLNIRGNKKPPG